MKIKQVEELVGISKKNIRFYEEVGLLEIERAENGYREYHEKDLQKLREIKFLRKLYVPIEEIKRLFQGEISLEACLLHQLHAIEEQKKNLDILGGYIKNLQDTTNSFQSLDHETALYELERLEKEGVMLVDIRKEDVQTKKVKGAIFGAGVMVLFMIAIITVVLCLNATEPLPGVVLMWIIAFPVFAIIGTIAALIGRLREIKGGEEDEAAKY